MLNIASSRTRLAFSVIISTLIFLASPVRAAYLPGVQIGTLPGVLPESSGIAASRNNVGILWSHNDSGDGPNAFALSRTGAHLATYTLSGTAATDWEDMAIGPAPGGQSYLYMGDIGDNNSNRSSIRVHRFVEPSVSVGQPLTVQTIASYSTYVFQYADGARNAEGLMVDPVNGDLYVVTKSASNMQVYRALTLNTSGTNTLQLVRTFTTINSASGADISADGTQIIIRNRSTTAYLWNRAAGVSIADALALAPELVTLRAEAQGEAIAFDETGLLSTSETNGGGAQPIFHYTSTVPEPSCLAAIALLSVLGLSERRRARRLSKSTV